MKRTSVVAPLILIVIGVLFLLNNLNPHLSLIHLLTRSWPWLLIGWGLLRLIEIAFWAVRGKPLPASGISGGEWALIIFITLIGSGAFFVTERAHWPSTRIRIKGVEVFGRAYDYPVDEQRIEAGRAPRVIVENTRGNIRINGAPESEVRVAGRRTVRAYDEDGARRAADQVQLHITKQAGDVVVRCVSSDDRDEIFVTTDLELTVPAGARVIARGRRGDMDITNIAGDVEVESENAGVRAEMIGGNVRVDTRASDLIRTVGIKGSVELKGLGRNVEVDDVRGQVTVAGNYFGDLRFRRINGPVRFESGTSGRTTDVRVEACSGEIRVNRGNLTLAGVTGPVVVGARSKDVEIADFTQSLELRLERGDIQIRPGRLPAPKLNAVTDSGNIQLELPEKARFTLKASAARGSVENEYGDVLRSGKEGRIETLAGSVGNGPEISLRTDRGQIRIRRAEVFEGSLLTPEPPPPPPAAPRAGRNLPIE